MRLTLPVSFLAAIACLQAAPIDVTGGFAQGNTEHALTVSGDGFYYTSALPDWLAYVGPCTYPCDQSGTYLTEDLYGTGWHTTYGGVTIGDPAQYAPGGVAGTLTFTPLVAPLADQACARGCEVTVPISLSGDMQARYADGILLYHVLIAGTGTLSLSLQPTGPGAYLITYEQASWSGTATPTAEPSTWWLMAPLLWLPVRHARRRRIFR